MSWGVITGQERLIESIGGANEIKLESGKPKKVALLLAPGQEPYSFFQHTLEIEKIENGQTTNVFRTINCPKTKANPYAHCPLCDGQQAKRRIRHSSPAWEYESNSAKLLTNGESVFKPMGTLAQMGMDPSTVDWIISKTGTTRNDTEYSAVNVGVKALVAVPDGTTIPNPVDAYKPHTVEQMKEIVEGMGLNWESMIVPPPLQYPVSLQAALDHVIPNTKYKNQTMKQVWDTNRGMIEFFAKSNRMSPEKAAAQVILVALAGQIIDGVPNYALGNAPMQNQAPVQTPVQTQQMAPTQTPGQVGTTPSPASQPTTPVTPASAGTGDRQVKINEINKLLQSNQKFVKGGYTAIIDTMKQASAPNSKVSINEFTDVELDKMLELCRA